MQEQIVFFLLARGVLNMFVKPSTKLLETNRRIPINVISS